MVAVAGLLSVLPPLMSTVPPFIARPPFTLVIPAAVIVPAVQVYKPVVVNAAVPCSVPPDWVNATTVSGLLTLSAPETSSMLPVKLVPAFKLCTLVEN